MKTGTMKTEKLLSRVEYLRQVGANNFTEQKYQEYKKANENYSQTIQKDKQR